MKLKKWFLIGLWFLPLLSFAEDFMEGKDYQVIPQTASTPKNTMDAAKPVVMEFFSYGCPWCYRIEPNLEQWQKQHAEAVVLQRVPMVYHKDWIYYAKAYYAAEALGLQPGLNEKLFTEIQTKKTPLNSNEALVTFFVAQGVDRDTAESAFQSSTSMDLKIQESNTLMKQYQIQGVPAFVINDRYKTDLGMAKTPERLFAIVDFLVKKPLK